MNPESYRRYSRETESWLHFGRKKLIKQVLSWHLPTAGSSSREILEVGAGVGQNVEVLKNFGIVDVMEVDPLGIASLEGIDGIRSVFKQGVPCEMLAKWDVICAFDVIEHIEDDAGAIRWIFDRLRPGGVFIATVPAHQWLFSDHDRALGHYRRYDARSFDQLLPSDAVRLSGSYFNSYLFPLGVLSRVVWQTLRRLKGNRRALGKQSIPTGGLMEPMLRAAISDDIGSLHRDSQRRWGLSYYLCARKLP